MKKISAVLLVLVLVGSVAFAGFTGSANVDFAFDLDSTDYGFVNGKTANIDVKLLEAVGAAKGEGDVYADIAASLSFSFNNADEGSLTPTDGTQGAAVVSYFKDGDEAYVPLYVKYSFTHAKIVGDGWSVGILGALDVPNFATSAVDSISVADSANKWGYLTENDDVYADLDASELLAEAPGVEVMYNDYKVGFGLKGNTDDSYYHMYGSILTPAFELGDGLTAQLGAAAVLADNDTSATAASNAASASVKVAYAADEYSAEVAADLVYDNEEVQADVALAAAYDIFTLDAYYATKAMYDGAWAAPVVENLLSAKVGFTVDAFTISVTGADLANTQDLSAQVKWAASDALTLTVDGGYVIDTEDMKFGALAKYVADKYTATAEADVTVDANGDADLELDFDVETTSLINGATLYAGYYAKNMLSADKLGKVTVGVEIEF